MLNFAAKAFRGFMNVILWLILIGCAIGGFVLFGIIFRRYGFNLGLATLGLFVGGLIGLINVIVSGGLIANFLNMVDDIRAIKLSSNQVRTIPEDNKDVTFEKEDKFYIAIEPATLRFGSSPETGAVTTITDGDKVKLISDSNPEWFLVETSEGKRGYCPSRVLKVIN